MRNFWQDMWAAKLVFSNRPEIHYDIGSRLDGFIAHILAMGIPVKMIDIRPFPTEVEGLDTIVDDATYLRHFAMLSGAFGIREIWRFHRSGGLF